MLAAVDNKDSNTNQTIHQTGKETALEQINIVYVDNQYIEIMDMGVFTNFEVHALQIPAKVTIADLKTDIMEGYCKRASLLHHWRREISEKNIRLWRLDPAMNLNDWFREIKEVCQTNFRFESEYKIIFKGSFLEKDILSTLEHMQISKEDYIFVEIRDNDREWHFYADSALITSIISN